MEALTIAMQQSFQTTVAQSIAKSLQNNNTIELMSIIQPDYNSQTSNTTNNQAQVHNTNETNNTSIISPNNLKRKSSNGKTNNSTNNINLNGSTTTTTNTNSDLTNAQKQLEAFSIHKRHEQQRIMKQVTDHNQIESILPFLHNQRDRGKKT